MHQGMGENCAAEASPVEMCCLGSLNQAFASDWWSSKEADRSALIMSRIALWDALVLTRCSRALAISATWLQRSCASRGLLSSGKSSRLSSIASLTMGFHSYLRPSEAHKYHRWGKRAPMSLDECFTISYASCYPGELFSKGQVVGAA